MIMYVLFAIYLVKTLSPIIFIPYALLVQLYYYFFGRRKNSGVGMVIKFEINTFGMSNFHYLQEES